MKTRTYTWGNRKWTFYDAPINRKRQLGVIAMIGVSSLLPGPNFIGIFAWKAIKKVNPLFLYQ